MKVVINDRSGFFDLSSLGVIYLIKRGSKIVEIIPVKEFFGTFYDKDTSLSTFITDVGDGFKAERTITGLLYKEGYIYTVDETSETRVKIRTDKDLVALVEEFGQKSGGSFSNLRIVEVPDGVEFTIEEASANGSEEIHEKHRVWL